MRISAPPAFCVSFFGPEGPYEIDFKPTDFGEGVIDVCIGGNSMRWHVEQTDQNSDGVVSLGGLTSGTKGIWHDVFWFELRLNDAPPVIRYWGNRVIWRQDLAV